MKRKLENTEENLPEAKIVKRNPADIALELLQNTYRYQLNLNALKEAFPDLSIATCHELLKALKEEPALKLPNAPKLINILFSHLLTCDYKDTPQAIPDFCDLLMNFHADNQLPRTNGRLYNDWLGQLDWDNPLVLQQLPTIFHCLKSIITSMLFVINDKDYINIPIINDCLSLFVKTLPDDNETLRNQIPLIFSAVHTFLHLYKFTGKLSTPALEILFLKYQQANPEPEQIARVATYLIDDLLVNAHRKTLKEIIPTNLLANALLSLAKHNVVPALKLFDTLIAKHYGKQHAHPDPFQAEVLQAFIDCLLENDVEPALLLSFVIRFGHLVNNHLTVGKVERVGNLFPKIPLNENTIFLELRALIQIQPILKTALDMTIVEKYLVLDVLCKSNKNFSMAFHAIHFLESRSYLSGQLRVDLFPFIDWVVNKNPNLLDARLLTDAACFIGTGLLKKQITTSSQPGLMKHLPTLLETLYSHLHSIKPLNEKDTASAFNTIKCIAQSEFSGTFNTKYLNGLLCAQLTKPSQNIKFGLIADCLYALGIAAKKGHIQNFPMETIQLAFQVFNSKIKPEFLFRSFTAAAYFINNHALNGDLSIAYLSMKFKYLTPLTAAYEANTPAETKIYWKELCGDIPSLLQFPAPLNGQLLVKLLPFMVDILQDTPDKMAIEAILNTCKQMTQSTALYKNFPSMSTADFNKLVDLFYAVNGKEAHQVLSIAVIKADLVAMGLLKGSEDLELLLKTLIAICPETLLSNNAHRSRKDNILQNKINILTVLAEYILSDIQNMPTSLLADIFDVIRIMVQQKNLAEQVILETDKRWIHTENKYMERQKYLLISQDQYTLMEESLRYILFVPDLQTHQHISILKGLFSLLKQGILRNFPAELLFAFFIQLDTKTLTDICSQDLPLLLANTELSFIYPTANNLVHMLVKMLVGVAKTGNMEKITSLCSEDSLSGILKALIVAAKTSNTEALEKHCADQCASMICRALVLAAKTDDRQLMRQLCEAVISTFMVQAASFGNIEDIKLVLPLIYQTQQAARTIQVACKAASYSASWPDVVQLLLQSPVFTDAEVQSILVSSSQTFKHANSTERMILMLFRLITYRGMDTDFVATALTFMETRMHQLVSQYLLPRLNNMIHHARALEKHSLFACTATQSQFARHVAENNTIDFEDAEKILNCQNRLS